MKHTMTIAIGCALLSAAAVSGQTIRERQQAQHDRIARGIASRELTPAEAARLRRLEANLAREIRRERVDGGGLSLAERARIDRQQDRLSREIFSQTHDRQGRR